MGYVGCVSIGCLADKGHKIIGVDINSQKVNLINSGKPTIIEKDIDRLIENGFRNKMISATTDSEKAVLESEISFICAGTPVIDTGHLNLSSIYKISEDIANGLEKSHTFHTIVIRSTVSPGTNSKVEKIIEEKTGKQPNIDFAVVSNPEFLREGTAVLDYFNPAVTVLGSNSKKGIEMLKQLYAFLDAPIVITTVEVAEIIKYVNNSFHALKISFANEVGNICKTLNIDSHEVMRVFGLDKQLNISTYYLKPGFAYGGSCLPKDLSGLKTLAHDSYIKTPVLNSIDESNQNQKDIAFSLIAKFNKSKIGILGLSFKKGTDDLRFSPAVDLTERLLGKGYQVKVYDKNVNLSNITGTNRQYIESKIPHLANLITDNLTEVVTSSEVIVITYKEEVFSELIEEFPDKMFIDLIRILDHPENNNYEGICW